jgi:hypothetical protein
LQSRHLETNQRDEEILEAWSEDKGELHLKEL